MGRLILGRYIRLTGNDADDFRRDTGRSQLPQTISEYNQAYQQAADLWWSDGSPEGGLLAQICELSVIDETGK